jgi:hypothetical protein
LALFDVDRGDDHREHDHAETDRCPVITLPPSRCERNSLVEGHQQDGEAVVHTIIASVSHQLRLLLRLSALVFSMCRYAGDYDHLHAISPAVNFAGKIRRATSNDLLQD